MKLPPWRSSLCLQLDFISHQLEVRRNAYLSQFGITSSQAKILLFLLIHEHKPVYQKDLEVAFSMRSSTITSIMGYLEKGGFVVRTPCSNDGRAKQITVTQKGRDLHKIIDTMLQELEQDLCRAVEPEDYPVFQDLLAKVSAYYFHQIHRGHAESESTKQKKEETICSKN